MRDTFFKNRYLIAAVAVALGLFFVLQREEPQPLIPDDPSMPQALRAAMSERDFAVGARQIKTHAATAAAVVGRKGRQRLIAIHDPDVTRIDGVMETLANFPEVTVEDMPLFNMSIIEVPASWNLQWLNVLVSLDDSIEAVGPDTINEARAVMPNDPNFSDQRHLHNESAPDLDINAREAWAYTTGTADVIVAVMDSGIDYTYDDWASNLWVNRAEADGVAGVDDDNNGCVDDIHGCDFVNDDGDPWDDEGHGTAVASVIGMRGNNGKLGAGINWNASIMSLKVLGYDSRGRTSDIILAYYYVLRMRLAGHNIRLINASFSAVISGASQCDRERLSATRRMQYIAIEELGRNGVMTVQSAGNDSSNLDNPNEGRIVVPACFDIDGLLSVASLSSNGSLARSSNYGAESVDLAAPGTGVFALGPGRAFSGSYTQTPNYAPAQRKAPDAQSETVVSIAADTTSTAGWSVEGGWARVAEGERIYWTDSPDGNYPNRADFSVTRDPIDLSEYGEDDYLFLSFELATDLEYEPNPSTPPIRCASTFCDALFLEISVDGRDWRALDAWSDVNFADDVSIGIPRWAYSENFQFRFRLVSDPGTNKDGVRIYDIALTRSDTGSDVSVRLSGTSFAAPMVTGAAALLWSFKPDLTLAEVRSAILDNVRPSAVAAVQNGTASGGTLDAAAALHSVAEDGIDLQAGEIALVEGEEGMFALRLTRPPQAPDSVDPGGTLSSDDPPPTMPDAVAEQVALAVTADPASRIRVDTPAITFTPQNWHIPQAVRFTAVDDNLANGDAVARLQVAVRADESVPSYRELPPQTVVVSVADNESKLSLAPGAPTQVAEGASVAFALLLEPALSEDLTVTLTTTGSAIAGQDYQALPATITIAAGEERAELTLTTIDDDVAERTERVLIRVLPPSTSTSVVQDPVLIPLDIEDDDVQRFSVALDRDRIKEGERALVTIDTSIGTTEDVALLTDRIGGDASPEDYQILPAQVTLPAGRTQQQFFVAARTDDQDEADETLIIRIRSADETRLRGERQLALTLEDTTIPELLPPAPVSVGEGETAHIELEVNTPVLQEVSVWVVATGTAVLGADYPYLPHRLLIPAGSTRTSFLLRPTADDIFEPDEQIRLGFIPADEQLLSGSQTLTVTVRDTGARPELALNPGRLWISGEARYPRAVIPPSAAGELVTVVAREETDVRFGLSVRIDPVSAFAEAITIETSGAAVYGQDYLAYFWQSGLLTGLPEMPAQRDIATDTSIVAIFIEPIADDVDECLFKHIEVRASPGEDTNLTGEAAFEFVIASTSAPSFSVAPAGLQSVEEGQSIEATLLFCNPLLRDEIFYLSIDDTAVSPGAAAADPGDYIFPPLFAAPRGATQTVVRILIRADGIAEPAEELRLVFNPADPGGGLTGRAQLSLVIEDRSRLSLAADAPTQVAEGASATFALLLEPPLSEDLTLMLTTTGSAIAGQDYRALPATITIAAGKERAQLTLTTIDDAAVERTESVLIRVLPPSTSTSVVQDPVLIPLDIEDNDAQRFSAALDRDRIKEGERARVTIDTPVGTTGDVAFLIDRIGGDASPEDYQIPATVTLPAGQTEQQFFVTALTDDKDEADEELIIRIRSEDEARLQGEYEFTLTLEDTTIPELLPLSPRSVEEGTTATIELAVDTPVLQAVSVAVTATGTAVFGTDYSYSTQQLVIAAGSTRTSFLLEALKDDIFELEERIILTFAPTDEQLLSGSQTMTVTIRNTDERPKLALVPQLVVDGDPRHPSAVLPPSTAGELVTVVAREDAGARSGFSVSIDPASAFAEAITIETSATAVYGQDYRIHFRQSGAESVALPAAPARADIATGTRAAAIFVEPLADDVDECKFKFIEVRASPGEGTNLTGEAAFGFVIASASAPSFSVAPAGARSVAEGQSIEVTLLFCNPLLRDEVINLRVDETAVSTGTAAAGPDDYALLPQSLTVPQPLTAPKGATQTVVRLLILADDTDEPAEELRLLFEPADPGGGLTGRARISFVIEDVMSRDSEPVKLRLRLFLEGPLR